MQIPPPSYVAQVWLSSNDHLCVHFPQANDGHGHTIHLSGDVYGLTCMLQILRERLKDGPYTVGHKSTPTQWQIDRDIARIKMTAPKVNTSNLSKEDVKVLKGQAEVEKRKQKKYEENMKMLQELGLVP